MAGIRSLDVMTSRPGIYVMSNQFGVCVVEVDDEGRVFQCLPVSPFPRDGELRPGGWNLEAIGSIVGPLQRAK